jgi:sugar phosphate isomerase/epimerase
MGIAETALHPAKDTIAFLDWAWSLGAGGIQAHLSSFDADYLKRLRARAEQRGMYLEVMGDLEHMDRIAPAASAAGARAIRVVAPGARRYEAFATLDDWRRAEAAARKETARAIPIAAQARVPIAIENHRDRTLEEVMALMREFAGDWFGVNLDTGNNIALLDDPMELVEQLAPYAVAAHIKDMGVEEYKAGFLIDEVAFGSGVVDVPRACKLITRARLTMEMLTRDPTPVACLEDHYWQVLPDRKGSALARTLRLARGQVAKLPRVTGLSKASQAAIEEETIRFNLFKSREFL